MHFIILEVHQVKGEKMKYSLFLLIVMISVATTTAEAKSHIKNHVLHSSTVVTHPRKKQSVNNIQRKYSVKNLVIKKHGVDPVRRREKLNNPNNVVVGVASWYGYESGQRYRHKPKTASGDIFSPYKLTAAHRRIAFGTTVKVTNLENNRSVIVKINDRGPYSHGRIIDLSKAAAQAIGMDGVQRVSLTVIN